MYQHTPSFLVDMKKRRTIRVLAILVFLVTILTGGWSFFTEYQIQQVRSEGGIALEVAGDEGIAHVSQSGYRVKKGDIGWYKRGDIANVKETTRTGYTFLGWYQDTTKVSDSNPYSHTMTAATKLVAKTKINSYRITAELDGGTINGSPSWSQTYTIKDTVTLPTPVKTGYNFLGWVEKGANNTPNKNVVIPVGSTGDKTYVAKWEIKKFEVDINGILDSGIIQNNTRGMGTFETYVNGVLAIRDNYYDYCDRAVPYGTEIEIKNIKAEIGRTYVKSSQSLKFTVTGNVSMTLQFKTNEYTYRFNANGGTGSMSDIKAKHGTSVKIPTSTFKKDYHTQTDWNTVAGGTGTKYALGGTISGYSGKDGDVVTLYAQWRKNKISISYNANGGKMGIGSGADYKIGTDGDILKGSSKLMNTGIYGELITGEDTVNDLYNVYAVGYVTLVKTGYHTLTTSDWNTQTDGSGKSYDSMLAYKATDFADLKDSDKSVTLYANWKPNNYKVRYNGNGATSGTMTDSAHVYDTSKVLTRNAYARTGYTFTGWNTKADGKGTAYANGASVKNLTASKDEVVTLYAQWKANRYTLTYNANGGTVSTSSKTLQYGDAFGTLPTPKRDGHRFLGWYTSATGGTKVSEATKIGAENTTIYAHWEAYTLSINYHGDGAEYLHDFDFDENKELGLVNVTGKDIVKVQTVRYGSKLSDNGVLDGGRFKKTGYTAENLVMLLKGGTSISTQVPYTAVELATKVGKQDAFKTGNVSIDIYPKWVVNKYVLSFDPNGGTVNPTSKTVSYGSPYGDLPTPTKSGNTFLGWFTEKDGGTRVSSTTTTGASNVTLYAHWKLDIRDTVLGDRSVFSGTFGQYIKNNSYIYSIEIGTEGSGSLEATYDVSKNQDNSVKARVYRQNYMYYTISIMPETGYRMVAPDNCVLWFAWDATDLSRIQSISISQVDFKNTRNMSHMFNYCGIRDVTLRGINNKNIVMNGMFEGCDSLQSITVDSLWRFDSSIGLDGIWTNGGIDYGGNTLPSYRDATYYKSTSYVYLETGAELRSELSSLITSYPSKVAIVFGTPSGGLFGNAIDVSESKDGSVLMNWGYSGGSMSSGVIYIYPSDSTKKIALNTESRGMFDSLYNNVPITVDFGTNAVTDVLTRNTSTSLVWHASSDLKYTGDDICGLVSNPNNRSIQLQSDDVDNEQVTSPDVDTPDTQKDTDTTDSQKGTDISDESLAIDTPDVQEDINTEVTDSNDVLHEESSQVGGIEEVIE